jgi:hypothetical protein
MLKHFPAIIATLVVFVAATARADTPALFDPNRHMRVDEVRPGMKGYGLTVFQGTKIDRFDVEVVSVLHKFNPKYDVVLIRCTGEKLEHTGPVSGMSGSPIFLRDEQGRERMIGAFAYGWPMVKDPIAGVQPIEYMLSFPTKATGGDGVVGGMIKQPNAPKAEGKIHWSLAESSDFRKLIGLEPSRATSSIRATAPRALSAGSENADQMQPLVTPLLATGLPSPLVEKFGAIFRENGLALLQAGGGAGNSDENSSAKIEPGSVLASPILTGDMELSAVGTCTEVVGDYVVGFGHPFNNEGKIELPFSSGEIQGVVARLDQSFKLGSASKVRGTLINDQIFGVAGKFGEAPPMIPIDFRVSYTDGTRDAEYHFNAAQHAKLTPLVASLALNAAISSARDLPQYHTIEYALNLEFANGKSIKLSNVDVNVEPMILLMMLGLPMQAASENPFERVAIKRVEGTIKVTPQARSAQILYVNVPKLKYRPGETLKAYVNYRPFRAAESIMPIELELPRDLPDGTYRLVVSDWQRYFGDEIASEPFKFSAENATEVFAVLTTRCRCGTTRFTCASCDRQMAWRWDALRCRDCLRRADRCCWAPVEAIPRRSSALR